MDKDAETRLIASLLFFYQNIFRSDQKGDGNDDHNRDLPNLHFVKAQNKHHRDREKDDVQKIAGNGLEFGFLGCFEGLSKFSEKKSDDEDDRQKIFWIKMRAHDSRQDKLRDDQQEISDHQGNEQIFGQFVRIFLPHRIIV